MLLVQSNSKANGQSHNAHYHDEADETYPLPTPSPSDVGIVPQVLKLLSLRTRDVPHAVLGGFLSILIPRRLAKKSSAERTMVRLLNSRWWRRLRWMIIAIFVYNGQSVLHRAGTRASPASPGSMARMARQGTINEVGRPHEVERHRDQWRTWT